VYHVRPRGFHFCCYLYDIEVAQRHEPLGHATYEINEKRH
jgi:hypothetical protein